MAIVLGVWLYVLLLHADNNGLWFQGDAPRHAVNGFFWQDYVRDFSLDAKTYALRYYARYPAINPAAYPPFFYLLEASVFALFGPSPLAAKLLVQVFSLIAALYLFAWLHRWISRHMAWAAAFLLLIPGIVLWSHAVMLNVPALALVTGSLYHARAWLETSPLRLRSKDFYLAVALVVLALLTYYPAGVGLLIIFAWMLGWGGLTGPRGWRAAIVSIAFAAVLVPCVIMAARFLPTHVDWVARALHEAVQPDSWAFYLSRFPAIFGLPLLVLAGVGWVVGLRDRESRRETWWSSVWIVVTYCSFSVLVAKEARYVLFLAPALVCLAAIALCRASSRLMSAAQPRTGKVLAALLGSGLLASQAWVAWHRPVPAVNGFTEVAAFLREVAPTEPVFYDGYHSGVFVFRVRAMDPDLQRQVILGNKLLYTFALHSGWRDKQYVASTEDVIRLLRERGGCRWLAIEIGERSQRNSGMQLLREAVGSPDFELIRSFPIVGANVERIDVYRMQGAIGQPGKVRLPFPLVSKETLFEVEPIPSRRSAILPRP